MPDSSSPNPGGRNADADRNVGTRLESIEEIRQAAPPQRTPTVKEARPQIQPLSFRPVTRAPMALLCIFDDGSNEGEWIRIRMDITVLGRVEGDVVIPHDGMMSARHAQISREVENGTYRWYLTDLQSTNGTFIRVGDAPLKTGQELLIGGNRYRFEAPTPGAASQAEGAEEQGTRGWHSVTATDLIPSLVKVTPQGDAQRLFLKDSENWIGADAARCAVVLADDPLVSPRHLRIYKDKKGNWHVENAKSQNGSWIRVNRIPIDGQGQFQLGEQRFLVRIP